ncbi:MAG: C-terminal binding protein [Acidimicrobiales bacterium]|jgi:D-3-phosphoglycerate dehydrogenase
MSSFQIVVAEGVLTDVEVEAEHLSARPAEVRLASLRTAEDVARETRQAHAVVVTVEPMPRSFVELLGPDVRIIARAGIGLDAIDLDAARDRGIAVFHTPDYATEEVATHTVALMLALNRKLLQGDELARKDWQSWARLKPVPPMSVLTVGIVGLGRIGRAVADRVRPFAANIVAFDPFVTEAPDNVRLAETLDELLAETDVLTLHLPVTDATRGLIGARELGLLRPGAVVVNVARGALLDQVALVGALRSGRLSGAGLDVLAVEPLPDDDPITTAPNVILSPHFAWYSDASNSRTRTMVVDGILDYLEGKPVSVGRLAVAP